MFEIIGALVVLSLGAFIVFAMLKGVVEMFIEGDVLDYIRYYDITEWVISLLVFCLGIYLLYIGAEYFISHLEWAKDIKDIK